MPLLSGDGEPPNAGGDRMPPCLLNLAPSGAKASVYVSIMLDLSYLIVGNVANSIQDFIEGTMVAFSNNLQ
jgi:hypothetical protein